MPYRITLTYSLLLFMMLSVSKIPSDDILESLYKLRTRESDQLKNRVTIVRHGNSSGDYQSLNIRS